MSTLADILSYMAMLSRENALYELDDKFFYADKMISCYFGMTSDFYFVATGRPEVREAMVDLAVRYYEAGKPAKGFIVVEEKSKNLASAQDIAPIVKTDAIAGAKRNRPSPFFSTFAASIRTKTV